MIANVVEEASERLQDVIEFFKRKTRLSLTGKALARFSGSRVALCDGTDCIRLVTCLSDTSGVGL